MGIVIHITGVIISEKSEFVKESRYFFLLLFFCYDHALNPSPEIAVAVVVMMKACSSSLITAVLTR